MIRITQFFKATSQAAQRMHYDYEHKRGTVFSRYDRPSQAKIQSWCDIVDSYTDNGGYIEVMFRGQLHHWQYNYDVAVVGASSHFYSTIASFKDVDTGIKYLVKETHANTYACQL